VTEGKENVRRFLGPVRDRILTGKKQESRGMGPSINRSNSGEKGRG